MLKVEKLLFKNKRPKLQLTPRVLPCFPSTTNCSRHFCIWHIFTNSPSLSSYASRSLSEPFGHHLGLWAFAFKVTFSCLLCFCYGNDVCNFTTEWKIHKWCIQCACFFNNTRPNKNLQQLWCQYYLLWFVINWFPNTLRELH